jgi:regulatory protein
MASNASFRPKKKLTEEMALQRLESLCAGGEHCRHELSEKLRKWGMFPDESERILDSLERRRFFDDSRFASAFVRDKLLYNKWGRMKIVMALKAKRVDTTLIDEAFDEIDNDDYREIVRDFLSARARTIKAGFTYEGRTKLYRAGLSRGFESSIVSGLVKDPATWGEQE